MSASSRVAIGTNPNPVLRVFRLNTGEVIGRIADLHEKGLIVIGDVPLSAKSEITLSMVLPTVVENKTTLSLTGKVDWCHANKHNPAHVSCLTLVKISAVDKRILRYLINNFDFSLIPDQLPEPA